MSKRRILIGITHNKGWFLGGQVSTVLSIPYASNPGKFPVEDRRDMYYTFKSISGVEDPKEEVLGAEAYEILMGSTPKLLMRLYQNDIFDDLRTKIENGTPIIGVSAGAVILGPTIATTNDPIPEEMDTTALGILPFHINPHYKDKDWMGNSMEDKMIEKSMILQSPILGMGDDALLSIEGNKIKWIADQYTPDVVGKLFLPGEEPREISPEDSLDFLLE